MRKILYSPGFGAGWTTWNDGRIAQIMLDYAPIIERIEAGGKVDDALLNQMVDFIRKDIGDPEAYVCILGADDLRIKTVSGRVRIHEYDGSESVEEEGDYDAWI